MCTLSEIEMHLPVIGQPSGAPEGEVLIAHTLMLQSSVKNPPMESAPEQLTSFTTVKETAEVKIIRDKLVPSNSIFVNHFVAKYIVLYLLWLLAKHTLIIKPDLELLVNSLKVLSSSLKLNLTYSKNNWSFSVARSAMLSHISYIYAWWQLWFYVLNYLEVFYM